MIDNESDAKREVSQRLLSLDVYRGIVMFTLFASGFGLAKVADAYPENDVMQWLKFNTTHPKWSSQYRLVGFSLWDMIQPAFMFMVGVSMPYSYRQRKAIGDSYLKRLAHAWTRSLILVLLGVALQSMGKPQTNWLFTNVLSQIGLGYGFLFFLVGKGLRIQFAVGGIVLILYGLFLNAGGYSDGATLPQRFDRWFLNLFPRVQEFTGSAYSTLNFVPSFVTMLLGLACGELLIQDKVSQEVKLRRLFVSGTVCLLLALLASIVCPIVKKLWTPSWVLFSGAYVIWLLTLLYWLVDCKGWKRGWVVVFVVVGMNSIAAYLMGQLLKPFTRGLFRTHLPDAFWDVWGPWRPFIEAVLIAAAFWIVLLWMYRKKLFLRI